MPNNLKPIDCPCCRYGWAQYVVLTTDWGFEDFLECQNCGIIFREKEKDDAKQQ